MQLPYPAPLPGWTCYGHPCLTSRPFLTMHSSQHASSPRLFPVHLSAHQVYPGTGNIFPAQKEEDESPGLVKGHEISYLANIPKEVLQLATMKHLSPRTDTGKRLSRYSMQGNPACIVREADDNFVALTPSGSLTEVAFFRASFCDDLQMEKYEKIPNSAGSDIAFAKEDGQVLQLVATDRDPISLERGVIAARMRDCFYVGCFQNNAENLKWTDRVTVEDSCVVALNCVSKNEIAALDAHALSVFDLESSRPTALPTELQPLHPRSLYRWLRYASHPRTLFLANSSGVGFIDLRCLPSAEKDITILNPRDEWNLCNEDSGICFFERHPRHPFQSILVTSSLLTVIDSRMLHQPVLEWNINCSESHLSGAIAEIDPLGKSSEESDFVVALSSAASSDLWVFHASRRGHSASEVITPQSNSSSLHSLKFQRPQLLWSDMPLQHLDRFGPRHEVRGIAIISFSEKKRISLLQSSVHSGAISQLLGCEPFEDGTHIFEPPVHEEEGDDDPALLHGIDSFANILNARDVIATKQLLTGDEKSRQALGNHFEKDFSPGLNMLKRLSRLDAGDGRHLRRRICRADDNGEGILSQVTLPRGFVSDLKTAEQGKADL